VERLALFGSAPSEAFDAASSDLDVIVPFADTSPGHGAGTWRGPLAVETRYNCTNTARVTNQPFAMSSTVSPSGSSSVRAFQPGASQAELWHGILADPQLQDLPFKIETNERGQLVLSPHKRIHSIRQTQITDRLANTIDRAGIRSVELAIGTSKGVKVVDVAWMSSERFAEIDVDAEPTPVAPELCVEVVSASNTEEEMAEKRVLYFDAGAEEVWVVGEDGKVSFYNETGSADVSALAPDFPRQLPDPA
jgi:Uma2 family endonuclease